MCKYQREMIQLRGESGVPYARLDDGCVVVPWRYHGEKGETRITLYDLVRLWYGETAMIVHPVRDDSEDETE